MSFMSQAHDPTAGNVEWPPLPGVVIAPSTVERQFNELAAQWKEDIEFISSTTEIAMQPSYQRIIGLGPAAIPCIMRELEQRPRQWFWALRAITGVDPVPADKRGNLPAMAKAWLDWGRSHGFKW
jgi:hypothetical protein